MSDARTRQAQRLDPNSPQYLRELLRSGQLAEIEVEIKDQTTIVPFGEIGLELNAYCGDEGARRAFLIPSGWWVSVDSADGLVWGPPDDGDDREDESLSVWAAGLHILAPEKMEQKTCPNIACQDGALDPNMPCDRCGGSGHVLFDTGPAWWSVLMCVAAAYAVLPVWIAKLRARKNPLAVPQTVPPGMPLDQFLEILEEDANTHLSVDIWEVRRAVRSAEIWLLEPTEENHREWAMNVDSGVPPWASLSGIPQADLNFLGDAVSLRLTAAADELDEVRVKQAIRVRVASWRAA